MFEELFHRYLQKNPSYKQLTKKVKTLEQQLNEKRKLPDPRMETTSSRPYMFPPQITIQVHHKDTRSPYSAFRTKSTKRKSPTQTNPPSETKATRATQTQKDNGTAPSSPLHTSPQEEAPTPQMGRPFPEKSSAETAPSQKSTYIEFLNIEKVVIDRYEQSNNFGALGIKSLEGTLNIGANYGNKDALPEELKQKLSDKMELAEAFKTAKNTVTDQAPSSSEKKADWPPTQGEASSKSIDEWEDFFQKQPIYAENNRLNRQVKKGQSED